MPLAVTTAVILAGGRATRMGGDDKGLLPFHGVALVERILERLAPQVEQIVINANRNLDHYARYGYPVINDLNDNFDGPLAGILSAMRGCDSERLITLPCDAPFLASDYIARMEAAADESGRACIACHGGEIEPLFALLPRSLANQLEQSLACGERKARHWIESLAPCRVDFDDRLEMFTNLNRPEDLSLPEARREPMA